LGLLTEYPIWFTLLCLLLGALYAFFLYSRQTRREIPVWIVRLMTLFRFLSVSIIAFLLLSPMIRTQVKLVEKPLVIIGQDNSASLLLGADSSRIRSTYPGQLESLVRELSADFDVQTYSVGERVTTPLELDFSDQQTNLADFFRETEERFENRNVGAVILASDGIHNMGPDPVYATRSFPFPIYTVALGDTSERKDIRITRIIVNRQVHLGDYFPIEIQVDADGFGGTTQPMKITFGSQELSVLVSVTGNHFSRIIPLVLKAGQPGWQKITVSLSPLPDETIQENNSQQVYVEILEQQAKIVIVYDAPHPDIAAISEALQVNRKYLIEQKSVSEFLASGDTSSVHLFYQVPAIDGTFIPESRIRKLPSAWFILGTRTNIQAWNNLQTGITLDYNRLSFTDAYPQVNERFPFFSLDPSTLVFFQDLPPLQSPFAAYKTSLALEVLLYQKINGASTRFPLIAFQSGAGNKRCLCFGENPWRWRMQNFLKQGDHEAFNELIQKTVHYLAVKPDQSYLRIYGPEKVSAYERIAFDAELFNKNYEPVPDQQISLTLEDDKGNTYPFVFVASGTRYSLNAGMLSPGEYRYYASTTQGRETFTKQGVLLVEPSGMESVSIRADHSLLLHLAESHQGKMLYPDNLDQLVTDLTKRQDIHSVIYLQKQFTDLIDSLWLLALILTLLVAEWFLRKYYHL